MGSKVQPTGITFRHETLKVLHAVAKALDRPVSWLVRKAVEKEYPDNHPLPKANGKRH